MEHVRINRSNINAPAEIVEISNFWTKKANEYGDVGSCVIGAKFEFDYKGVHYTMTPRSMWQGSMSWEAYVNEVKQKLISVGATHVVYHYGTLD
jgi:hypothetical protein